MKLKTVSSDSSYRSAVFARVRNSIALPDKVRMLQGNIDAPYIVLAPPPNYEECGGFPALPWTTADAQAFFSMIVSVSPKLDVSKSFLTVPSQFFRPQKTRGKQVAEASLPVLSFLREISENDTSTVYLCAGPKVFSRLFRAGAECEPEVTCGYWLYPEELNGRPVLVFPDPTPLTYSSVVDDYPKYRDFAIAQSARWSCEQMYKQVMQVWEDFIIRKKFTAKLPEVTHA